MGFEYFVVTRRCSFSLSLSMELSQTDSCRSTAIWLIANVGSQRIKTSMLHDSYLYNHAIQIHTLKLREYNDFFHFFNSDSTFHFAFPNIHIKLILLNPILPSEKHAIDLQTFQHFYHLRFTLCGSSIPDKAKTILCSSFRFNIKYAIQT